MIEQVVDDVHTDGL